MGGRKKLLLRNWFVCCSALCFLALALGGAGSVLAQDDEFILEEIVVTGSRIVRNNNESSSPIVTVDEKLFQNTSTVAIETALNKLPQFTPTLDVPTSGGDIQPNARNTPGEATVALRGVGSNRTLVLINGRRGTPSNAMNVVDINTIPSAAIEYVEAISGGASSVYGADAMAGVLNFIMKEHFEGAQLDAQASINEEGDNLEYQYSGIVGANIADDRGNVSMAFSYTERQDAKRKDHKWYRDEWKRTTVGGDQFFAPYAGITFSDPTNVPSVDVANSVVDGANYTSTYNFAFRVAPNGQVFSGYEDGESEQGIAAARAAGVVDSYVTQQNADGILSTNNVENYLIFPMERYNVFTRGNYDINDWLGIYGQAYFNKTSTVTIQEPGPLSSFWDVSIDPTINRDVIPSELMALIDSRPNPDAPVVITSLFPFTRGSETDTYTYNMVVGLNGTIPKIDWTWDFNVQHGEAETTVLQTGFASLQRIRAIMTQPNFGEGFVGTSNPEHTGFAAATGTCTSGLNPFTWGETMTEDCFNAIRADIKTKMFTNQDIYELNFEGPVVELPAGEMRAAVGYVYRENEYTYLNDNIVMQGTSFLEQAVGLYPSANTYGSLDVGETYAELLVPVLKDLPFVQNFNLELGARHSDYNTTGVSYTYKALADWRIVDWLRIRGGYNRAERAPNIAELYLSAEQTFAFGGPDVCSVGASRSYSANPDTNPEHWQDVVTLCGQLMEMADPTADDTYYKKDYREVLEDPSTVPFTMASYFNFLFPTSKGNPNLEPETADTYTVGLVIDSPFRDIPYLADTRLSIDYYTIKITDAIGEQTANVVMQQCVDPRFNPTYDPNSPYCELFPRDTYGNIGNLQRTFLNSGRFRTAGLDIQLTWGMDLGPGRLGVTSTGNYLIEMKSSELDINPLVEYAGTQGPNGNGLNGGSYRFRLLTDISYQIDDLRVAVQWNHLGPISPSNRATSGYDPDTPGIREYDLFNLSGNYNLTANLWIRFGVDNVLNEKPPYSGQNFSDDNNGMIGGTFSSGRYDTLGRRYWIGARVNF